MKTIIAAGVGMLVWAVGIAQGAQTAAQKCDSARLLAWRRYVSCVQSKIAKDYRGGNLDSYSTFERCRRPYFKKWIEFQSRPGLASSACVGARFVDNGDGTVIDHLTTLVWEKKTNLDSTSNYADPHDADNVYSWSTGMPFAEDGSIYGGFLAGLNGGPGFGGAKGWRIPSIYELQTILLDFTCPGGGSACFCGPIPCVALGDGNTQPNTYWSATAYAPSSDIAWYIFFDEGGVGHASGFKVNPAYARAVRAGF